MTAPNHALLVTLLAVFTACAGYAVGRLHQWYRTGLDRDEAYRDGYETATRSVFSTAARLIAPRRAARGTAPVTPVAAPPAAPVTPVPAPPAAAVTPVSAPPPAAVIPVPDTAAVPAATIPASRTVTACTTASRAAEASPGSPSEASPGSPPEASPGSPSEAAEGQRAGRHLVPDELVQAPTYRLAPDRVARAKVREVPDGDDEGQQTTRLPSVPRPRSS